MNNKEIIKNRELLLKNIGQLMDYGPNISLKESLAFYSWHCDHHFSHIENIIKEKGW